MNQIVARTSLNTASAIFNDGGPDPLDLYNRAASLLPMGAWSCDLADDRLNWTDKVFDIFGLCSQQTLDRQTTIALYSEESRDMLERKRWQAIEARAGFTLDASIVRPDGVERRIRITAATQCSNGRTRSLYGMKQDITEDHARWEALRAQAELDPLTGVANRARFQQFLDRPEGAHALDRTSALILFDMDDFKRLNDCWGHAAGDACLVTLAGRLRTMFAHADLVSRIGGDEFAVLLPPSGSRRKTERAVQSIIADLLRPVPWQGDLLPLGVSVGIAFAGDESELGPQQLFIAADKALYSAKRKSRSSLS